MPIKCKFILILLAQLPFLVHAASINGKLTGNKLDWVGAIKISGSELYTPSGWEVVHNLEPTTRWKPGTHSATTPEKLVMSGPSGSVSASIKVVGLEFHMGNLKAIKSGRTGNCEVLSMNGSTVALLGESCRSDLEFSYPSRANPFYFIRPIVQINEAGLISDFEGMESGKYTGSLSLVARYEYYTSSGALTYRNIPYQVDVELDYKASYLTSVNFSGNGTIEAFYNVKDRTVSGSTSYHFNAKGYFSNGVKLRFFNRDYSLSGPTKIPYSIYCQGPCSSGPIVSKGVLLQDSIVVGEGQLNKSNINFTLDINYKNIHKDDVVTGAYNDTVTIVFEENI